MSRAGSRCLSVFSHALNARVLRAHSAGPLRPGELEAALGWAPQSSLRAAVGNMCELGALTKLEGAGAGTELTVAGRDLLPVAKALERWLATAPDGSIALDDAAAQGVVKVLTAAWDSTLVRALAEGPQTLLQLNAQIGDLNYPALRRRLAKLRLTGLVEPVRMDGGTAFATSDWLRRAIVPLTLAGRWEREHDADADPISRVEAEAALLLALPVSGLPSRASGACTLAVVTSDQKGDRDGQVAGVTAEIEKGSIVSRHVAPADAAPTWALGTIDAWFEAVIDGNREALRLSGAKPRLARNVVDSLHSNFPRF